MAGLRGGAPEFAGEPGALAICEQDDIRCWVWIGHTKVSSDYNSNEVQ